VSLLNLWFMSLINLAECWCARMDGDLSDLSFTDTVPADNYTNYSEYSDKLSPSQLRVSIHCAYFCARSHLCLDLWSDCNLFDSSSAFASYLFNHCKPSLQVWQQLAKLLSIKLFPRFKYLYCFGGTGPVHCWATLTHSECRCRL